MVEINAYSKAKDGGKRLTPTYYRERICLQGRQ